MVSYLSSRDAAYKLGITQELLWMYVRYSPKPGEIHKLPYSREHNGFSETALTQWAEYLQSPWVDANEKRPSIPAYIQDYLKVESTGQCTLCGAGHKLEYAHINSYKETRNHHHHNLIRLCTDCHSKYDDGIITKEDLQEQKNKLVAQIRDKLSIENDQIGFHLTNVPVFDAFFLGRNEEKKKLLEYLETDRPIVVQGVGGIGKTQLVLNTLTEYLPDQQIVWMNLENISTTTEIETALVRGIETINDAALDLWSLLQTFQGIIVFDGVETGLFSDWDAYLDFLTQVISIARHAKFILTSQSSLIGLRPAPHVLLIESLPKGTMLTMFQKFIQDTTSTQINSTDIDWFVDFADGHPLTARITLSLLDYFKDSGKVKQRIQDQGVNALRMPIRSEHKRSTALNTSLLAAYECFTHDQKRLLQYLTRFPEGCFIHRAASWQKDVDFDTNLAELQRLHFVYTGLNPVLGYESIFLLNPIKNFVALEWKTKHYKDAADIQFGVASEMSFWASYINFEMLQANDLDRVERGLALIKSELGNFFAAIKYGIWWSNPINGSKNPDKYLEIIIGISHLSTYFFLTSQPTLAIDFNLRSAEAYVRRGELVEAIEQYDAAATTFSSMYDLTNLRKVSEKINEIHLSTTNPIVDAYYYMNLGRLAFSEHDYQSAISSLDHSLQILLSTSDSESARDTLRLKLHGDLALAYQASKQPHKALEYYEKTHTIRQEMGIVADDGVHYHQVGNCYFDIGQFQLAEESYTKAAVLFSRIANGRYLTNSLSELGHLAVGNDLSANTLRLLSKDLLHQGLNSLLTEIEIFSQNFTQANFSHDAKFMLIRKTFTIIGLLSFSPHVVLLEQWANDYQQFQNEFIDRLRQQYPRISTIAEFNQIQESPVGWLLLRLHDYALLARCVSQSNLQQAEQVIDEMFGDSYLDFSIEIEDMRLKPYRWLEKWKSHK